MSQGPNIRLDVALVAIPRKAELHLLQLVLVAQLEAIVVQRTMLLILVQKVTGVH